MPTCQRATRHSPLLLFAFFCVLCASAVNVFPARAGQLNPPPGPISPTPGPEPRTAINSTNTPGDADSLFKITQPGSYYLAGNITGVSGKHGIEIDAANVTLDLNGFALRGVTGTLDAIHGNAAADPLVIRNGTISSWIDDGIELAATTSRGFLIEHLTIDNCGDAAIVLEFAGVISDCSLRGGGVASRGVDIDCCSLIQRCRLGSFNGTAIRANQSCTVLDNHLNNCNAAAISAGSAGMIVRNTIAHGLPTTDSIIVGTDCTVRENTVSTSGLFSLIRATSSGNRIEGNHLLGGGIGIRADTSGNVIVRNSVSGQDLSPFQIAAGNATGPSIGAASISSNTNPDANYQLP